MSKAPHVLTIVDTGTDIDTLLTFKDIDRDHRARGYLKCGFHFVVERDGKITAGRPITEEAMATPRNIARGSTVVCLVGSSTGEGGGNFTDEQEAVLGGIIEGVEQHFPGTLVDRR